MQPRHSLLLFCNVPLELQGPRAVLTWSCLSERCPQSGCVGLGPLPTVSHLISPPQTSELVPLFWKLPCLSLGSVLLILHLGPRKSKASLRFLAWHGLPGKLRLHSVNLCPYQELRCLPAQRLLPQGAVIASVSHPTQHRSAWCAKWASEQKAMDFSFLQPALNFARRKAERVC